MTQREYIAAYRAANTESARLVNSTARIIKQVYIDAAEQTADVVRRSTEAGLSDLTSSTWNSIRAQLQEGADQISQSIVNETPIMIERGYQNYANVDEEYIGDAIIASGNNTISRPGIRNIVVGVNDRLVAATATRTYSDGFTFSERVWKTFNLQGRPNGVNGDYQYRIRNLILTGQAQGRDPVAIAEDITLYALRNSDAVFREGRYGRLVPGTGEFRRRISRNVDWRALRIVRSEMNASLQAAGVLEGAVNPAATGMYDWVKTIGNPIDPDGARNASGLRCIDLDRNSPYAAEDVPDYQHSNCSCHVRPRLMDQREFVDDLRNWTPGSGPEYLDSWFRNTYSPAQN